MHFKLPRAVMASHETVHGKTGVQLEDIVILGEPDGPTRRLKLADLVSNLRQRRIDKG